MSGYSHRLAQTNEELKAFSDVRRQSFKDRGLTISDDTLPILEPDNQFFLMFDEAGVVKGGAHITLRDLSSSEPLPTEKHLGVSFKSLMTNPDVTIADVTGFHIASKLRERPDLLMPFLGELLAHLGESGAKLYSMMPTMPFDKLVKAMIRKHGAHFAELGTFNTAVNGAPEEKKLIVFSHDLEILKHHLPTVKELP